MEIPPNTRQQPPAYIYLRTATTGAGGHNRLAAQRARCHEAAARIGATVIEEFVDHEVSGRRRNNRAFTNLVRRLSPHWTEYVIVASEDRLARNHVLARQRVWAIVGRGATLIRADTIGEGLARDVFATRVGDLLELAAWHYR